MHEMGNMEQNGICDLLELHFEDISLANPLAVAVENEGQGQEANGNES